MLLQWEVGRIRVAGHGMLQHIKLQESILVLQLAQENVEVINCKASTRSLKLGSASHSSYPQNSYLSTQPGPGAVTSYLFSSGVDVMA